jgi:Tfp pilus assembly protein PilW
MRKEQGFSLSEALIATTLTILLAGWALSAFNRSLGLNEKVSGMGDLEQNLRAGLNLVVSDLISAGWLIQIGGMPVPNGGSGTVSVLRPSPSGLPARTFATNMDSINPGQGLGPVINGQTTDIVNILYADNVLRLDQSSLTDIGTNGSSITVASTLPISGVGVLNPIQQGDLIALSNSNGNAIQYVTGVNGQIIQFNTGTTDVPKLNQPNATNGSVLKLRNIDGTFPVSGTIAKRVWLITYYLDVATDSSRPRLMRQINYGTPRAVALVLENFQLTYDIVDLATNPTNVDAPSIPSQIRKANILLSGRSTYSARETSEFLRKSLTTQVSIRSLSFMDRYH